MLPVACRWDQILSIVGLYLHFWLHAFLLYFTAFFGRYKDLGIYLDIWGNRRVANARRGAFLSITLDEKSRMVNLEVKQFVNLGKMLIWENFFSSFC